MRFGFVGKMVLVNRPLFPSWRHCYHLLQGTAYINGFNITKEPKQVRKQIGYMPDFFGVYDHLKADEYLDFYGAKLRN